MSRRGRGDTPPDRSAGTSSVDDEKLAFAAAMRGVRPLSDDQRAHPPLATPGRPARPRVANFGLAEPSPSKHAEPDRSRSTSAERLLRRRVERGELRIGARLDLHGKTVTEAQGLLRRFVASAYEHGERCVLVVHGKGYNSPNGMAVLRPNVERWLAEHPQVALFADASARHGGSGARYVLLSKRRA